MMKVEFRLDEDTFMKYVKEVEKQILAEAQSFHKNENIGDILKQHQEFFAKTGLMIKVETCLENLDRLARTFTEKMPGDIALQESYTKHKDHWDQVLSRIQSLFSQLQQIPEEWKSYEDRFALMVKWMDQVEENLVNMFNPMATVCLLYTSDAADE